jgi:hypothetical protein
MLVKHKSSSFLELLKFQTKIPDLRFGGLGFYIKLYLEKNSSCDIYVHPDKDSTILSSDGVIF